MPGSPSDRDRQVQKITFLRVSALVFAETFDPHPRKIPRKVDTSTPTGRMVFTVLGAVAETRTQSNCVAGPGRPAERQSEGKEAGTLPGVAVDASTVTRLRAQGFPGPRSLTS